MSLTAHLAFVKRSWLGAIALCVRDPDMWVWGGMGDVMLLVLWKGSKCGAATAEISGNGLSALARIPGTYGSIMAIKFRCLAGLPQTNPPNKRTGVLLVYL